MIGFSLNRRPPMAPKTFAGKFGGFWQVDADDARLITLQVSMFGPIGLNPPQMSILEKPLNKIKIFKLRLSEKPLNKIKIFKLRLS
jgi:hypothetical protein